MNGVKMERIDRIGRRVKLRDLHILLAVTQAGSMGRAAARLAVSQPVVSKAIADLERTLGTRLFDRGPQGIVPTEYGKAMIQCGRAVLDELQKGVRTLEFLSDPTKGELRVGCTEMGALGLVPLVIERLVQRHPGLQTQVITADSVSLTTEELPRRRVEVALGAVPAEVPTDIEVEQLFEDRQVIMAGANSPWVRRRRVSVADLIQEPWVLPPPDSPVRRSIDDAFAAIGLDPPAARVATFSMPLCQQLLASGRYLTVLPRLAIQLSRQQQVKPVNVEFPGIGRPVGIMTLRNRTLSPLARRFVECARETASSARAERRDSEYGRPRAPRSVT
jgi:DNA-binding transcriptional LysR family regulator